MGSHLDDSLTTASTSLSIATNTVTTMMIAYKLWYVPAGGIHRVQWLTMKCYCRSHRTFIVETPGSSRRKSQVHTILVLLVESGLVYLGLQVSHFHILFADMGTQDPQSSYRSGRSWSWFSVCMTFPLASKDLPLV